MAAASPTPLGNDFPRRVPSRQFIRNQLARPNLRRGSPVLVLSTVNKSPVRLRKQYSVGDSSDDESSAPLLSAEAEELLSEELRGAREAKVEGVQTLRAVGIVKSQVDFSDGSPSSRGATRPTQGLKRNATGSPVPSASPRVVRLSIGSAGSATLRRATSISGPRNGSPLASSVRNNINTPAPRLQAGSIESRTMGLRSASIDPSSSGNAETIKDANKKPPADSIETQVAAAQSGAATINRVKTEETGMHSSVRVARFNKFNGAAVNGTSSFLRGPARRGPIRRHSEEEQSPVQEEGLGSADRQEQGGGRVNHPEIRAQGTDLLEVQQEERNEFPLKSEHSEGGHVRFASQSLVETRVSNYLPRPSSIDAHPSRPRSTPPASNSSKGSSSKRIVPIFNVKAPPLPSLPSRYDQENQDPPPTFKRNVSNGLDLLERPLKMTVLTDEKMSAQTPATVSPQRRVLGLRSHNTPHRPPPPPPPKMSMIDTVTSTAGAAAASESKKKRSLVTVNGKQYQRLEILGRGGSAKVYRVMAANWKILALKRVSLEEADELSIRGFKGEIDLLRKLEKVERVVNLYDFEMNEDRQSLSILMELGESDFNRVLNSRLNAESAKFDITFTRFFWKEMLECVQAVHEYDIVHSDLKPANFLLFKDKLKLIDFGIANAIQDDTVNVHRQTQIGTPNYMAPEALVDFNVTSGIPSTGGKVMKMGKPSDVWSLGCILYQMVYGRPPFAHLSSPLQKMMAIPNPNHVIEYPKYGLGNAVVPNSLIRTLKSCLNRDQKRRPTTQELLAEDDPFLHPDLPDSRTVPVSRELLASIQRIVANQTKKTGLPSEAEAMRWAEETFARLKKSAEEGRVW